MAAKGRLQRFHITPSIARSLYLAESGNLLEDAAYSMQKTLTGLGINDYQTLTPQGQNGYFITSNNPETFDRIIRLHRARAAAFPAYRLTRQQVIDLCTGIVPLRGDESSEQLVLAFMKATGFAAQPFTEDFPLSFGILIAGAGIYPEDPHHIYVIVEDDGNEHDPKKQNSVTKFLKHCPGALVVANPYLPARAPAAVEESARFNALVQEARETGDVSQVEAALLAGMRAREQAGDDEEADVSDEEDEENDGEDIRRRPAKRKRGGWKAEETEVSDEEDEENTKTRPSKKKGSQWKALVALLLMFGTLIGAGVTAVATGGASLLLLAPVVQFFLSAHMRERNMGREWADTFLRVFLALGMLGFGVGMMLLTSGLGSLVLLGLEISIGYELVSVLAAASLFSCYGGSSLGGALSVLGGKVVTAIMTALAAGVGIGIGVVSGVLPAMAAVTFVLAVMMLPYVLYCKDSVPPLRDDELTDDEGHDDEAECDDADDSDHSSVMSVDLIIEDGRQSAVAATAYSDSDGRSFTTSRLGQAADQEAAIGLYQ